MSSKALRLLQKEKEKPAPASLGEDEIDECAGNKNIRNVFNLVMYKCIFISFTFKRLKLSCKGLVTLFMI